MEQRRHTKAVVGAMHIFEELPEQLYRHMIRFGYSAIDESAACVDGGATGASLGTGMHMIRGRNSFVRALMRTNRCRLLHQWTHVLFTPSAVASQLLCGDAENMYLCVVWRLVCACGVICVARMYWDVLCSARAGHPVHL